MNPNWKAILDSVKTKVGPEFNQGRWVTSEEGRYLREFVRLAKAETVYESGTANGFSSCWLASGLPENEGVVHTFDPVCRPKVWDGPYGIEVFKTKVQYHQAPFRKVTELLKNRPEGPALFFIDGDHGQELIWEDWGAIHPFLKKGDIIVFHDLNEARVRKAVFSLKSKIKVPFKDLVIRVDRIMEVLFYGSTEMLVGDETIEPITIKLTSEMDHYTEKVRDIPEWRDQPKPWAEYTGRALISSSECHLLYDTPRRLGPGNYANLGAFTGKSAACLAFGLRDAQVDGKIYSVDDYLLQPYLAGYPQKMIEQLAKFGLDKYVEVNIGSTNKVATELRDIKFNFIFVDAGHTYKAVKDDFDNWSPLLLPGGEIAFQDCEYTNVHKVVEEDLIKPNWEFVRHVWRTKVFRKVK